MITSLVFFIVAGLISKNKCANILASISPLLSFNGSNIILPFLSLPPRPNPPRLLGAMSKKFSINKAGAIKGSNNKGKAPGLSSSKS